MNAVQWIRELPRHMSEALFGLSNVASLQGARRLGLAALLFLTAVATAIGLTDLIRASEAGKVGAVEFAVVAALAGAAILTMWLALEYSIALRPWWKRIVPVVVYLILVLWSIGFGFGFYWKHIASIGIAQDETAEMVERVSEGLDGATSTLSTIQRQLNELSRASQERTNQEERAGGACDGVASGAGAGPYWNLRGTIKNDTDLLLGGMVIWLGGSQAVEAGTPLERIQGLKVEAAKVQRDFAQGTNDTEAMRNTLLELGRKAGDIIRETNAIVDGRQRYVNQLRAVASKLREGYSANGLVCRDESLANNLNLAADGLSELRRIDTDLAQLDPKLGPRATRHAFNRLWANAFSFLPGNQTGETGKLGQRDLQALIAAIVVDIGIFFLTVFGRSKHSGGMLDRLLRTPLPNRELRRRLYALIDARGDGMRRLLDVSTAFYGDDCYLVASEDLPSIYGTMRNLQIILLTSGEGAMVRVSAAQGGTGLGLLPVIQRTLAIASATLEPLVQPPRSADQFTPDRMTVLRLSPSLMFSLQRLVTEAEGHDQDGGSETPYSSPRGHAGRGGADSNDGFDWRGPDAAG